MKRAREYEEDGNYRMASRFYRKVLGYAPQYAAARKGFANVEQDTLLLIAQNFEEQGNWSETIRIYERVRQINKMNPRPS